jgi:hypothetical protein
MSTTSQFEIPTDVRKITEKSVEQVKAISGYLHFLQRAVPGEQNLRLCRTQRRERF